MQKMTAAGVLDLITDTLVLQEKYANKEDALRALARTAVREKIARYRRRSRRFQSKYSMDFAAFSCALESCATPRKKTTGSVGVRRSTCSMTGKGSMPTCLMVDSLQAIRTGNRKEDPQ